MDYRSKLLGDAGKEREVRGRLRKSDFFRFKRGMSHNKYIRYGLVARICRSHAVPTRPGFNSPCRKPSFCPFRFPFLSSSSMPCNTQACSSITGVSFGFPIIFLHFQSMRSILLLHAISIKVWFMITCSPTKLALWKGVAFLCSS
jgi:hypothetical protein